MSFSYAYTKQNVVLVYYMFSLPSINLLESKSGIKLKCKFLNS